MLLFAPACGLLADIALQAALPRFATRTGPIRLQFLAFGAGAVVTLILLVAMVLGGTYTAADRLGYIAMHLLIYACSGFCFFNVISANVSSLRVRILREMLALHPAPMDDEVLHARYSAREMLAARLVRLQAGGQVEERAGRYHLCKSGLSLVGGIFSALRRLLLKA